MLRLHPEVHPQSDLSNVTTDTDESLLRDHTIRDRDVALYKRLHLKSGRKSTLLCLISFTARSSCGRADSVMDSHTTGPGFKTR